LKPQPRKCICNLASDVRCKCIRYTTLTGNKEERINAWAQFISFIYLEPNENSSTESPLIYQTLTIIIQNRHDDGHDDAEDVLRNATITQFKALIYESKSIIMQSKQQF
jgi:hypothetical protein